ncbi:DUF5327 family protein [Gracilibacillus sp. YIM 98692]|uniref:DUF5327 family protein n=1 Tax=Gracilibacillus sp. YIM 98692 TaxID=2663532 RepID=UPI0013D411F0|nr:DUF5327 family protein [Gracilibacillus sp. YIM 98692]
MSITKQQILRKVIAECEQALQNEENIREHAKAVQSLTDLLLETEAVPKSSSVSTPASQFSEKELQQMMGDFKQAPSKSNDKKQELNTGYEEANGDSLLDF